MSPPPQLSLFAGVSGVDPTGPGAVVTDAQRAIAARLPANLYLGTSSWTFQGWSGIVYAGQPSKEKLVSQGLLAYARHPLLRVAGVDRSYYAPLSVEDFRAYARQVPAHFRFVAKAFAEVTTAIFPNHPRWAERAGQPNPRFLDPALALDEVVRPYLEGLGDLAGPIVFELAPIPDQRVPAEPVFLARLQRFLDAMPKALSIAFELRNPSLLTPRYLDLLRARGASHVLNFWSGMMTPGEQARLGAHEGAGDLVFRLLLPPGKTYEVLEAAYAPYDRIVERESQLRDDVVAISRRVIAAGRRVFVIIGNKAEGSAPLTLFELAAGFDKALAP